MERIDPVFEWFETDALGGFAAGTVGGIRTRRNHACCSPRPNRPADESCS